MNIVVEKYGVLKTLNKTRCIRINPLRIPARDLDGKVAPEDECFMAQQNQLMKEKIAYLKRKILSREASMIGPTYSSQKGKIDGQDGKKKLSGEPVPRKIAYEAEDFKEGDMVVVYLKEKKGSYLARVLRVWLPRDQEWETEKWIRLQLWGRLGKTQTLSPHGE